MHKAPSIFKSIIILHIFILQPYIQPTPLRKHSKKLKEAPITAVAGVMNSPWFLLVALTSILAVARSDDPAPAPDCVYTFYIQTGPWLVAGTDAKISLKFYDPAGNSISIRNIETWGGRMGPDYDYFERGNLDIFSGKGPCLPGPICSVKVSSDGSGLFPMWNVKYLELSTTGDKKACGRQLFTLEQWLFPPFSLTATKDNCRRIFATSEEDVSYDGSGLIGHDIN